MRFIVVMFFFSITGRQFNDRTSAEKSRSLKMFMLYSYTPPSKHKKMTCGAKCTAGLQSDPHSLPLDARIKFLVLSFGSSSDIPTGRGSICVCSVDPRKIQRLVRRPLMEILIKSAASDALGTLQHFSAAGTCQSQWNKSFRCQSSSMFRAYVASDCRRLLLWWFNIFVRTKRGVILKRRASIRKLLRNTYI